MKVKDITAIWEKYDHTTFNQQSVAVAFAKDIRAAVLDEVVTLLQYQEMRMSAGIVASMKEHE